MIGLSRGLTNIQWNVTLQKNLQIKLIKKATDQIPDGFILYKDAVFLDSPTILPNPIIKDNNATFTLNATLYGFILNEKNLTKKLVSNLISGYDGSEVYIPNIKDLSFSLTKKDTDSYANTSNITFSLTGNPKIVWRIDIEKLYTDLLGSRKKDFNSMLSRYINIASADLVLRPAWRSVLPDKKEKINIKINYP